MKLKMTIEIDGFETMDEEDQSWYEENVLVSKEMMVHSFFAGYDLGTITKVENIEWIEL